VRYKKESNKNVKRILLLLRRSINKGQKIPSPSEYKRNISSRWKPSGRNVGYLVENRGESAE
jgi:hypothetical protein